MQLLLTDMQQTNQRGGGIAEESIWYAVRVRRGRSVPIEEMWFHNQLSPCVRALFPKIGSPSLSDSGLVRDLL